MSPEAYVLVTIQSNIFWMLLFLTKFSFHSLAINANSSNTQQSISLIHSLLLVCMCRRNISVNFFFALEFRHKYQTDQIWYCNMPLYHIERADMLAFFTQKYYTKILKQIKCIKNKKDILHST